MKTFQNCAAQGDVLFIRIKDIPQNVTEEKPENGSLIVTHSETGHHHVMSPKGARLFRLNSEESGAGMISYLQIVEPTELKHCRPYQTHESIMFAQGNYEVRRQREYTPEGWRRVED